MVAAWHAVELWLLANLAFVLWLAPRARIDGAPRKRDD